MRTLLPSGGCSMSCLQVVLLNAVVFVSGSMDVWSQSGALARHGLCQLFLSVVMK